MITFEIPYTDTASKVLRRAARIAKEDRLGAVHTHHLLIALAEVDSLPARVLNAHGLTGEKLRALTLESFLSVREEGGNASSDDVTPLLRLILESACDLALDLGLPAVGTEHLFTALLQETEGMAYTMLLHCRVDPLELQEALLESMGDERFPMEDLLSAPYPGTDTLSRFTRDLTALAAAGRLDPVEGRQDTVDRVMQILCRRSKNNPCLIGEPGVGKTAVVEALAMRIASDSVPPEMKGRRILSLDIAAVVAGTKYRGEFEERMKQITEELASHPEIILFMDELHTLIGAGSAEGTLDAAGILKPALSRGEIRVIGATTTAEYKKHIEKDAALRRRFHTVQVEEPSAEETLAILRARRPLYEKHHRVTVEDAALTDAAFLSRRYVADRCLPDKALDLLDEACSSVRLRAPSAQEILPVTAKDIAETLSRSTGIPVYRLTQTEGDRLLHLEDELHRRIIGQEEAVTVLARAIRRNRAGLRDPKRPIGTFLFLGPTGVGKTELSKALAESLFGGEDNMIRVDMSEYMEKHSVSKMIGSPPGYVGFDEGGQLSDRVRRRPYSVVLFDEIEKAHPDVFHILLQILDEGRLTDAQGTAVDFRNTVVIMTSNAGAERIVAPKTLGFSDGDQPGRAYEQMKSAVMEDVKRLFRPEFLNRIDHIVVFRQLGREEIRQILKLQIRELEKRLAGTHPLTFILTDEAAGYLSGKGYDPKYGARPLRRLLQEEIEDPLSEEILAGRLPKGSVVRIGFTDGRIALSREESTDGQT